MRLLRNCLTFAVSAAATAGCVDHASSPLASPPAEPASARGILQLDQSRASEMLSVRASQADPRFGGVSFDEDGNMLVFMTASPGREPDARKVRALLEPEHRAQRGGWTRRQGVPRIIVRRADYSFADLSAYRDRANAVAVRVPGVHWTDLDESVNRLVVGIDDTMGGAVESLVRTELQREEVPLAAVQLVRIPLECPVQGDCDPCTFDPDSCNPPPDPCLADPYAAGCGGGGGGTGGSACPVQPYGPSCNVSGSSTTSYGATLTARWRPMIGGVAVSRKDQYEQPIFGTVGFSAWYCPPADVDLNRGLCRAYYVVTSHQTRVLARTDGDVFYNPSSAVESDKIGQEAYDPPWHRLAFTFNPEGGPAGMTTTCQPFEGYSSVTCRRSDMALIGLTEGSQYYFGYLARPLRRLSTSATTSDQLQVNTSDPWMKIGGEEIGYEGQQIDHIGITSGWRTGTITRRCVDYVQSGRNNLEPQRYVMRCQNEVRWSRVQQGDSGGPVFKYSGNQAYLMGIVRTAQYDQSMGTYTPLANIRNDLGLPNTDQNHFRVFGTPPT